MDNSDLAIQCRGGGAPGSKTAGMRDVWSVLGQFYFCKAGLRRSFTTTTVRNSLRIPDHTTRAPHCSGGKKGSGCSCAPSPYPLTLSLFLLFTFPPPPPSPPVSPSLLPSLLFSALPPPPLPPPPPICALFSCTLSGEAKTTDTGACSPPRHLYLARTGVGPRPRRFHRRGPPGAHPRAFLADRGGLWRLRGCGPGGLFTATVHQGRTRQRPPPALAAVRGRRLPSGKPRVSSHASFLAPSRGNNPPRSGDRGQSPPPRPPPRRAQKPPVTPRWMLPCRGQ